MDNLNDLKAIWLTAKTDNLPASAEIVEMAKKYRNKGLQKKVVLIVSATLLTALMIALVFIYKSTMFTTRLGEGCIVICGLILVSTNLRSIGRFYHFRDYNNKEFIRFLEQTRLNQVRYYKKTQVAGFVFSVIGLSLYLIETIRENFFAGLTIYLVTAVFLLINWLYIRPRTYRRQKEKLEETIKRLEKISNQL